MFIALVGALLSFIGTTLLVWTLIETRRTARRQLRAYVTVDSGHYSGVSAGRKAGTLITLKNTGQTPAYRFRTLSTVIVHRAGVIVKYKLPAFEGHGVGVVGAEGEFELNNESVELSQELVDAIQSGALSVYVFGCVEYDDVFGRTHTLKIAMESMLPVDTGRLRPCEEGNEST